MMLIKLVEFWCIIRKTIALSIFKEQARNREEKSVGRTMNQFGLQTEFLNEIIIITISTIINNDDDDDVANNNNNKVFAAKCCFAFTFRAACSNNE